MSGMDWKGLISSSSAIKNDENAYQNFILIRQFHQWRERCARTKLRVKIYLD